jgi:DNA helicase-2/ATP-dependent DNA helicase PcrA
VIPAAPFKIGERVFHLKFGYGIVKEVEMDRLLINFEHAGLKKVLHSFVTKKS